MVATIIGKIFGVRSRLHDRVTIWQARAKERDSVLVLPLALLLAACGGGDNKKGTDINGTAGNDILIGTDNGEKINGGAGDDVISGGGGDDMLDGGAGDDVMTGDDGDDMLDGGAGDDLMSGSDGDDMLDGGAGDDVMSGGGGDDMLRGDGGADMLNGGAGADTADYSNYVTATDSVSVDLDGARRVIVVVGTAGAQGATENDTLRNIENVIGTTGDDTLTGDGEDNTFTGGGGADMLDGEAGSDTADYSNYVAATDSVTVDLDDATEVTATIRTATDGGNNVDTDDDKLKNIENVIGTAGDDSLTGDGEDNTFTGGGGADMLDGEAGSDTADYSNYVAATDSVSVDLDDATEVTATVRTVTDGGNNVAADDDKLENIENVIGTAGDDTLTGDGEDNIFMGGDGRDELRGEAGADTLIAGNGPDQLWGGTGADVFKSGVYAEPYDQRIDTIHDCALGEDTLDLSSITDWDTGTGGAQTAIEFIGTVAFQGAGEIRYEVNGSVGILLQVNLDSDITPELEISLVGLDSIAVSDLIAIATIVDGTV